MMTLSQSESAAEQLLCGPRYDATLADILPLGDGLPRVHLPSAALTSLGVQLDGGGGGVVVLVTTAHDGATRRATSTAQHGQSTGGESPALVAGVVAAFATLQPKLRAGEVSLSAAALDALTCGSAVAVGSALRVFCAGSFGGGRSQSGPPGPPCLAVCEAVTLQLLPPSDADAQPASSMPELEESLRRASLSTPPPSKGKPGSSTKSPASATRAHTAVAITSASTAWLRRAVGDTGSHQLLAALAARHMGGRPVFVGQQMPLSLLGRTAAFLVTHVASATQPDGHVRPSGACVYVCSATVHVRLLSETGAASEQHPSAAPVPSGEEATREQVQQQAADAALARALAGAAGPRPGFAQLAGVPDAVTALTRLVVLPLTRPRLFASSGLRPPRGVLLHGPPGCGKTRLAMAAAAQANVLLFVISGPELTSEYSGESEARLRGVFQAAQAAARGSLAGGVRPGAVVFIDEIDALAPKRDASAGGAASCSSVRCVTQLLTLLDGGGAQLEGIAVVAATNRIDALDPALRRPGRFDAEVAVRAPGAQGRAAILASQLSGVKHALQPQQLADLASSLHGYTGADIQALVARAALEALRRGVRHGDAHGGALYMTPEDMTSAHLAVRPSILREVRVEVPPSACWDDVAGLEDVKLRLGECLGAHAAALARLGVAPPRGVLLFGPPGCAKTTLARAVAARGGWNFICVAGSDLYSQWVGESEKAVAALFARAREAAPCVLFLDELDALAPVRGGGGGHGSGSGPVDRVLAQLLIELDGGAGTPPGGEGVMLMAATNRPDRVDPALLRPGRVDRLLYVPPPATAAEREAVLRVHLRRTPLDSDVDLGGIAAGTDGFSGADLASLCREACMAALSQDLEAPCVCARHLEEAQRTVRPTGVMSPAMEAVYARMARG